MIFVVPYIIIQHSLARYCIWYTGLAGTDTVFQHLHPYVNILCGEYYISKPTFPSCWWMQPASQQHKLLSI